MISASPNFIDMLADETIAEDGVALLNFLEKVNHPALTMDPMFNIFLPRLILRGEAGKY